MRGRIPKEPELRHRPRRKSTEAILTVDSSRKVSRPALTATLIAVDKVHPAVHRWWRAVWRSPMAPRWIEVDIEGLYLIAALRNAFWWNPSAGIAAEIRHQEGRFGLDVISRRRLDWRIEGATNEPVNVPAPPPDGEDPRKALRVMK